MRPDIHEYMLEIALATAKRSTCPRAHVGAILTLNGKIVATGYNGSIHGLPHCDDVGCQIIEGRCIRTIHAEMNALLQAQTNLQNATLYCTHRPCFNCAKHILQAGITNIYYVYPYNSDQNVFYLLQEKGIFYEQKSHLMR